MPQGLLDPQPAKHRDIASALHDLAWRSLHEEDRACRAARKEGTSNPTIKILKGMNPLEAPVGPGQKYLSFAFALYVN